MADWRVARASTARGQATVTHGIAVPRLSIQRRQSLMAIYPLWVTEHLLYLYMQQIFMYTFYFLILNVCVSRLQIILKVGTYFQMENALIVCVFYAHGHNNIIIVIVLDKNIRYVIVQFTIVTLELQSRQSLVSVNSSHPVCPVR